MNDFVRRRLSKCRGSKELDDLSEQRRPFSVSSLPLCPICSRGSIVGIIVDLYEPRLRVSIVRYESSTDTVDGQEL